MDQHLAASRLLSRSLLKRAGDTLRRRFADENGETLVEALVSTLIVASVFLMLSTAVVTAAKIDAKARAVADAALFDAESAEPVSRGFVVTIGDRPVDQSGLNVRTQNGYYFYESNSK